VATTFPAAIRISFGFSSILKAGGSGDSITAQEESLRKVPLGATRTRNTPSRNTAMRTFAGLAVNSTPSFSFSTRWTLPRCCQPCATAIPHPRAEASSPIPMRRANPVMSILPGSEEKRRTIRCISCCAETIRRRTAVSGREPLFEKRRRLCTFDSAPHRIQHAAAHRSAAAVKAEPIGKIHFARLPHDIEAGLAKLEASLLENDTQHFFSQNSLGTFRGERRHHPVAAINGNEFALFGNSWKFKKVERAIHRIEREEPRVGRSAELVTDAIKPEGHVSVRDLLQRADAQAPVQRRKALRGESPDGFLLRDVGFQRSNGTRAHHSLPEALSSGNRSTSQPLWRSGLP